MKHVLKTTVAVAMLMLGASQAALAEEVLPGANLESLLVLAKARNPEFAAMRHEMTAAAERVTPAGALMSPRFQMELEDITMSGEQRPTLLPSDVGSTRYTLSQELPWVGKRDLKRDIATKDTQAAQGRVQQTWFELAARIKTVFAQRYLVKATERLVTENLGLMQQMEKGMLVRYAGGLAAQQDVTRIQLENTVMRAELVALAGEWRQTQSRLNGLLAQPLDTPLAAPLALRELPDASKLDFNALSERLRQSSPMLAVETARVRSAEKGRDLTYKNRYPDIMVGVSAMQRQTAVKEWGLMVEFNIPIQRDALRAQERESVAMLASAQSRQEAVTNQALADLSENLTALEIARQTEHLMTHSLLPQADLTLRSAQAGYENGKADFASLLDAQRQILQAKLRLLKAQVEAQMRLAEIEKLLGTDL